MERLSYLVIFKKSLMLKIIKIGAFGHWFRWLGGLAVFSLSVWKICSLTLSSLGLLGNQSSSIPTNLNCLPKKIQILYIKNYKIIETKYHSENLLLYLIETHQYLTFHLDLWRNSTTTTSPSKARLRAVSPFRKISAPPS